jgi:Spirocyclase AveC-like
MEDAMADTPNVPSEGVIAGPRPITVFGSIGALLVVAEVVLVVRWLTSPSWASVPPGPTPLPDWMRIELATLQIGLPAVALVFIYWFVVRPWRADRTVHTDAMLLGAFLLTSVYDPLSNYFGIWLTYNAYLINRGTIMDVIPGAAHGKPGATVAFPLILIPAVYVVVFLGLTVLGCAGLRRLEARRPRWGRPRLIAAVAGMMLICIIVVEVAGFLRLGVYSYGGGRWTLFSGHYFQSPVANLPMLVAMPTALIVLHHFKDDRGMTWVERGASTDRSAKALCMRFLTLTAAVQLAIIGLGHLPASWFGAHANEWPADVRDRSYLENGLCETTVECSLRPGGPWRTRP